MEIRELCKSCGCGHSIGYKCDTCGTRGSYGTLPVHIEFGYDSGLDGTQYDFCDLKCLQAFIEAELKKGGV